MMIHLSRSHGSILLLKGLSPHSRKIESGSHGKMSLDIEGNKGDLGEIESMHQKCSGHIRRFLESYDLENSTSARSSFSGKRCFFFCYRCARYVWQLNFERHDFAISRRILFDFNTFRDVAIGSSIEGYYVYSRHHVSTRRCEIRSNHDAIYMVDLTLKKMFIGTIAVR